MATYRVFQKKANRKGEAPIYISFYINREKVEVPTKLSVGTDDFDSEKGIIKPNNDFYKDKNLIINNIKSTINDIFVRHRLRKQTITIEQFWSEYRNPKNFSDFFSFCEQSQKLRFQEVSDGTRKKHKACLKSLHDFKNTIHFDELNTELFRKYVLYLRNKRGNGEVTINKNIQTISIYLNEAVRSEYISENPVHALRLRGNLDTTAVALDETELQTLVYMYNQQQCEGSMYDVLEFFLFLCFSSLHIADAKALDIDQIGNEEFVYIRKKMLNVRPKVVRVPISDPAKAIIKKKKGNRKKGLLFEHIISDQKINAYLKEIAKRAGITKKLCAKVGRHTFATIFLRNTRDLNALKEIMGHSNIKQTLVYSHVLDQDRKEGIQIFNNFQL